MHGVIEHSLGDDALFDHRSEFDALRRGLIEVRGADFVGTFVILQRAWPLLGDCAQAPLYEVLFQSVAVVASSPATDIAALANFVLEKWQ